MEIDKPQALKGEYKGSPVITIFINENENYKFTFGLGKAKAILTYLDDIKDFVEEFDSEKKTD